MRVKLNGKIWSLHFVDGRLMPERLGECDPPDKKGKQIRIRESLKGELRLDTIIHEALHSAWWHIAEEDVETVASDLARILTRLGYSNQGGKSE